MALLLIPKKEGAQQKALCMLESAASAFNEIAKRSSTEDEWDVFGKHAANSLRSLPTKDFQRDELSLLSNKQSFSSHRAF